MNETSGCNVVQSRLIEGEGENDARLESSWSMLAKGSIDIRGQRVSETI